MMGSEEATDQGVDLNGGPDFPVQCSICLEFVETSGRRSKAKLQCGHEFHLDCIGSAFNMKGIMQCPNCRRVEKGQWLYANGSANLASDFSTDSWIAEQYPFFLVPYGFHICPFRGLMEMDDLSISSPAVYGHHDNFGGQMFPSPPGITYFTYFRPHPHASLNPNDHMNGPNFTLSDHSYRQNQILTSHVFPSVEVHYQVWGHPSLPSSATGSHMIENSHQSTWNLRAGGEHPFLSSQGPSVGTGSSSTTMATQQNPDSSMYAFGGIQGPNPTQQNPDSSMYAFGGIQGPNPFNRHRRPLPFPPRAGRSNGSRGFPALLPAAQTYDPRARFYYPSHPSTGYNLQVTQNHIPNYYAWGRGAHFPMVPFRHR